MKISFGIVNPELVKRQIADRVEEVGEIVEEQRKAAAENERLRRQAAAEELLEAASRAAVAKRAAKALRLRREQELTTRLFWLWRSWTDKALHVRRERLRRGRDWRSTSSETSRWRLKQPPSGPPLTNPSLTLVRKSLHSRRSMLAGQQITALTKINARSSEFEPKYLRTSIALWVDGGSQEAQCG